MFTDVINITGSLSPEELVTISKLDAILEKLIDAGIDLGQKILAAVVVYIIGKWLIKFAKKFLFKILHRKKIDPAVQSFLTSLINISLNVILIIVVIGILGVSTTSFAALVAAAGLAIGMAMKDNLSNFAGGVMILVNKPFKIGDRIVVQGLDGVVKSIGILYTVLTTFDNKTLYIPNGPLSTGNITNFSDQQNRRIDLTVNVGYGNDFEQLKSILLEIIESDNRIMKDPAPTVTISSIKSGNFDIFIGVWVNTSDFASVNSWLNASIYKEFSDKGIFVPSSVSVKMITE